MAKLRLKFRLWHLMLLVLLVASCMWLFTSYGIRKGVVVVDEFRVGGSYRSEDPKLKIVFRFLQPTPESSDTIEGQQYDYVIVLPPDFLPDAPPAAGDQIVFRYCDKPLWLGFGERVFWQREAEHPLNAFWHTLFQTNSRQPLSDAEAKAMKSIFVESQPDE